MTRQFGNGEKNGRNRSDGTGSRGNHAPAGGFAAGVADDFDHRPDRKRHAGGYAGSRSDVEFRAEDTGCADRGDCRRALDGLDDRGLQPVNVCFTIE